LEGVTVIIKNIKIGISPKPRDLGNFPNACVSGKFPKCLGIWVFCGDKVPDPEFSLNLLLEMFFSFLKLTPSPTPWPDISTINPVTLLTHSYSLLSIRPGRFPFHYGTLFTYIVYADHFSKC